MPRTKPGFEGSAVQANAVLMWAVLVDGMLFDRALFAFLDAFDLSAAATYVAVTLVTGGSRMEIASGTQVGCVLI